MKHVVYFKSIEIIIETINVSNYFFLKKLSI